MHDVVNFYKNADYGHGLNLSSFVNSWILHEDNMDFSL